MHCAYLSKPSDSEQAMHRSRALISVDSAQLGKAQWQVPIAVLLVLVHCNVERAVHRAQLIHLLFDLHVPIAINPEALFAIVRGNASLGCMKQRATQAIVCVQRQADAHKVSRCCNSCY